MPTGFERIIALIRRTGDRCIVVDAAGNPAYVLLPLEEYERLVMRAAPGPTAADSLVGELDAQAAMSGPKMAVDAVPPAAGALPETDQYFFEPIE